MLDLAKREIAARVTGSYDRVIHALQTCLADRTADECDRIFSRWAVEVYRQADIFAEASA